MRRNAITLFAFALLLTWAQRASAQSPCEDALRDAEKSYELGLFEDVAAKLSPCLASPTSRSVAIQVHSLLARAHLNNEEPEQARKEISTLLRLQSNYEAEAGSSARFLVLLAQVRREEQTTQVVSVSKTSESLREAPATVVVVTGDEIRRRGYLDLEELLHDLPGFDISRTNGDTYAYIYQRGYRSVNNDRLLLLVDGVEQNDLSTNTLYLSRQYPLINIDRVEVIHGPASTMYGANAYTGVISIVTRDAENIVPEKKNFTIAGQVTSRDAGTRSLDLTLAGKDSTDNVAWSVTGSFQKSKERDLSSFYDWDYSYKNVDYKSLMRLSGPAADQFIANGHCATSSPYFQCTTTGSGQSTVDLTPDGENLVRRLDAALISNNNLGFNDRAKNWSIYGKLRIANLTLGLETWRSQEGLASSVPAFAIGGGTSWTPTETAFYLKYTIPLERLKLNVFTRYMQTGQERKDTEYDYLHNYAWGMLGMGNLAPCVPPGDQKPPVSCAPATPWVERLTLGSLSTQLRSELNVVYESQGKLTAVTGLEFAKSSIQTTWDQHSSGAGAGERIVSPDITSEQIEHTDVALYAQGSYRPFRSWKLVLAGRLSHNEINNRAGLSGYGTLFTPRAAIIYAPPQKSLVLKAVYSEAFKDPSDSQKFGTVTLFNPVVSNGLLPERVRNVELSAGWQPPEGLSIEGSLYQAHYTNVVDYGVAAGCPDSSCVQFQNLDEIRVRGAQVTARYRTHLAEIWGNYTATQPLQLHPGDGTGNPLRDAQGQIVDSIRVSDIANSRVNLGVDATWPDQFRSGLRVRYVGPRPSGEGTTEPFSRFSQMNPYVTADVVFSYSRPSFNSTLQLIVENIFNKQYYDPTVAVALGAPAVLQPGRAIYLRFVHGVSLMR